jgi:hypothetical protein
MLLEQIQDPIEQVYNNHALLQAVAIVYLTLATKI